MTQIDILYQKTDEILRLATEYGACNVRFFGSVARSEMDENSDIDLLVDLEPGRNLLDLGGLLMALQELLPYPVDVTTPGLLKARIRERVLAEAIPLKRQVRATP